jgi:hypothetical protein
MNDKIVTIQISVSALDVIGGALGKLPYEVSQPIIDELRRQVVPQLQPEAPQPAMNDGDDA